MNEEHYYTKAFNILSKLVEEMEDSDPRKGLANKILNELNFKNNLKCFNDQN